MTAGHYSLVELAARLAGEVEGDGELRVDGLDSLALAGRSAIAVVLDAAHLPEARASAAAAFVAAPGLALDGRPVVRVAAARVALIELLELFHPPPPRRAGIEPGASVAPTAQLDPSVWIAAGARVEADAVIAAGVDIHAHVVIGRGATIGADSVLHPHVVLYRRTRLGARVEVHAGVVLGADGFGIAMHQGQWIKVAQLGGVQIGDDCEIGANTTIDRGAIEDTVLENDVRLDNQIQIGHNVRIGAHTAIAGCAAVAGSAVIGRYCLIGGAAGIVGHIEIADKVIIGAMSLVSHSIREAGEYVSGTPMQAKPEWRKNAARFKQLDAMARSLNALKKKD